jgi:AraC-like DNA-binding protein
MTTMLAVEAPPTFEEVIELLTPVADEAAKKARSKLSREEKQSIANYEMVHLAAKISKGERFTDPIRYLRKAIRCALNHADEADRGGVISRATAYRNSGPLVFSCSNDELDTIAVRHDSDIPLWDRLVSFCRDEVDQQVLTYLQEGYRYKEIAKCVGVSRWTVLRVRRHLMTSYQEWLNDH